MSEESWVEKHRPENWGDVQGNNSSLKDIKDWAEDWSSGDSPQFLYGHAGTGKTSTAYVVQQKMDWSMNQVNASSARTTDDIREIAALIESRPADGGERQLVLLDEVDNLTESVNLSPLSDALKNPKSPIILTANKEYDVPRSVRRPCDEHEFKLQKRSRRAKLKKIIEEEDLDVSTKDLANLVDRPDLRSSINDLQRYSEKGEEVREDGRDWDSNEFEVLDNLLEGGSSIPRDIEAREFIFWIDENFSSDMSELGKNLRGLEVAMIYDTLSRADRSMGRAYDRDYRQMKFAHALLETVGEQRLTETFGSWNKKDYPDWFRKRETKPSENSPESALYEKLSKTERNTFGLGGNYSYFRRVLLPILNELSKDERMDLAVEERLSGSALKALDIEEDEFEDWKSGSNEDWGSQEAEQSDVMDW